MDHNTVALRPPMGWNSYDYYDTNVTESEILQNAEFMAKHLKKFGWEYIVVDIQWYAHNTASMRDQYQYIPFGHNEMDEYGRLWPCPEKFPSSANGAGFKPLADKIHAMGLKFGIHIMRGIPRLAAHQHLPVWAAMPVPTKLRTPLPSVPGIRICTACGTGLPARPITIPFSGCMPPGVWISSNATIFAPPASANEPLTGSTRPGC